MEKLYITSLQNPLVKAWRVLKDAKARAEQGLPSSARMRCTPCTRFSI